MGRRSKGTGDYQRNNIRAVREKSGLTVTELAKRSGISVSYLSNLEQFKRKANLEVISILGSQLGVSASHLVDISTATTSVLVDSYVAAGKWRTTVEGIANGENYEVTIFETKNYPGVKRHACEVLGSSMNRIYPEGTVLVWVPFSDIAEPLVPGRRYIVDRINGRREIERTARTFMRDANGGEWFLYESDDPEFQAPVPYIPVSKKPIERMNVIGRVVSSIRSE